MNMVLCQCQSKVDHPRWSQASERVIGSGGLFDIKKTANINV